MLISVRDGCATSILSRLDTARQKHNNLEDKVEMIGQTVEQTSGNFNDESVLRGDASS